MATQPKFDLSRIEDCIIVSMNLEMSKSVLEMLGDFTDLKPHEFALFKRLEAAVESAERFYPSQSQQRSPETDSNIQEKVGCATDVKPVTVS